MIAALARVRYAGAIAADTIVNADTYWALLLQFARQHTRTFAADENPGQDARIGENMHPDLGYWNTRNWRAQGGEAIGSTDRGNDYFHSSFIDLVVNGLIGLDATNRSRPYSSAADGSPTLSTTTTTTTTTLSVIVEPLLPASANVSYRLRHISIRTGIME